MNEPARRPGSPLLRRPAPPGRRNGAAWGAALLLAALPLLLPPAPALGLGRHDVSEKTLSNGMRLLFVRVEGSPRMHLLLAHRGGASCDPHGLEGLACLAARASYDGTRVLGTRDFAEEKKILDQVQDFQALYEKEKIDPAFLEKLRALPLRIRRIEETLRETLADLGREGEPPMAREEMERLRRFVAEQEKRKKELAQQLADLRSTSQYFRLETRNTMARRIADLKKSHRAFFVPGHILRLLRRRGGTGLGAVVDPDFTAFEADMPAGAFEIFLWIEADRMQHMVIRDFAAARTAVGLAARREREDGETRYLEELTALAFLHHPYGRPLRGRPASLEAAGIEDALAFHRRHCTPPAAVLVCVGDTEPVNFFAKASEYFEFPPPAPAPRRPAPFRPAQEGTRRLETRGPGLARVDLLLPAPSFGSPDASALHIIAACLEAPSGHLRRECARKELLWRLEVSYRDLALGGLLRISAFPRQGVDPAEVLAVLRKTLENLGRWGFSADAVAGAVSRLSARAGRLDADPRALARALAAAEMRGGWKKLFERRDGLSRWSLDDLQRLYNRYVRPDRMTVGLRHGGE